MIKSLNQKIERVLLNNDHFKQDYIEDSQIVKTNKLTVLSQINDAVIDICMKQMTDKFDDFSNYFYNKIENIENQIKNLQFSLICRGRIVRSNSIDDKIVQINENKVYERFETDIYCKVKSLNEELESKFNEKIYNSITMQIENLKKEIHSSPQHNNSNNLKPNQNATNKIRHEKKQSVGNIISDIFSWKKNDTFNLTKFINDENNHPPSKFADLSGNDIHDISKVKLIISFNL